MIKNYDKINNILIFTNKILRGEKNPPLQKINKYAFWQAGGCF